MDINVHVTIDETPAMLTAMDALCEAIKSLGLGAPAIKAEEIPDEVKAAAQEVPSITVPTQEAKPDHPATAAAPAAQPAEPLSETEMAELRKQVFAFCQPDKEARQEVIREFLHSHGLIKVPQLTKDLLPAFHKLIGVAP